MQYLRLDVDLGSFADEQGSHVGVALLGGEVERSDALLGQDVGLGAVLQQHCRDFHLVLFCRNVEGSVAILVDAGEGERGWCQWCSSLTFSSSLLSLQMQSYKINMMKKSHNFSPKNKILCLCN